MKLRLFHIVFSTVLITVFVGCKKTPEPNFHFEYFGYEKGRYVVYDVMEITHDKKVNKHDTLVFQLKTKWGESYLDNQNREGREYLRFVRSLPTEPWVLQDKWFGLIDGIRAELVEENQRMVKLVFSPTLNKLWDLNAYNMNGETDSYYSEIHQDTTINNVLIDSTLTVIYDEGHNSKIDSVYSFEKYAKNIGLIHKHYKDNHFEFIIGSPGEVDPEVKIGKELYYFYVSSGIE